MKIHQLRFQNLNSLVGEWQIDFDNKVFLSNSIFAITGPTGAGKTTILDAICLALYGMTPRLSKVNQSTNEIMSRHSGQCFAELVFETHKGTFRAHWGQHKARNKSDGALQVYKHEVSDVLTGAVLESKASQVPEMIKELTGMDFEQFTRSILLAQGGFAAFLQASPDERAPILEQITGTGIYAQISRKVHERTREEKTRKEELENERSDIQILNDEEEAELRQQVELHTKQKKAEQARQESLDQAIKWLDQISGLENDIADLESLWKELDERKKSFQPDMLRLEQSRKALNLASAYTALSGLRDLQQKELGRLEELREEMPKQKEALENAETLMREATEQLANLKEHQRNEQEKIKKVREIDIRITEQQSTIDKYKHDIDAFKNKIHTIEEQQTETKRKLEHCKLDLKEYESYLRENQADKLLITNLTGIKKTFDRLGASSAQLVDVKNDLQDAEDKHRKAREHFKAKEEIYNKTNTLQKSAEDELIKLKAEIQTLLGDCDYPAWRYELQAIKERQTQLEKIELLINQMSDYLQKQGTLQITCEDLQKGHDRLTGEITYWTEQYNHYEQDAERLQTQLQLLSRIRDLEEERHHLEDGKPCPLCGSIHHPFAQGQTPQMDETEQHLLNAREASKQASKELNIRQREQTRMETEQNLKSNALQELRETYAELEKQYNENLINLGLAVPIENPGAFIRAALQDAGKSIDELTVTLEQVENKQLQERELRSTLETIHKKSLAADKDLQQAQSQQTVALHREQDLLTKLQGAQTQMDAIYQETLREVAPYGIAHLQLEDIPGILEQLKQRQECWIEQEKKKGKAEQDILLLNKQLEQQNSLLETTYQEKGEKRRQLTDNEEQLKHLQETRFDLYEERNPDDEERLIQERLTKTEEQRDNARNSFNAAETKLSQIQEQIEVLKSSTEERKPLLAEKEEDFFRRLETFGFTNEAGYLKARLSEEEQQHLANHADELSREETALRTRHDDKKKALQSEKAKMLTEQGKEVLEQELITSKKRLTDLDESIMEVNLTIKNNELNKDKLVSTQKTLEKQKQEYNRWEMLNKLIGSHDGKKYRNFAQGVTFDMMVGYANRQLRKMSDRYILMRDKIQPLALNVIDNYQAGEIRSTKNLSGGESFLVSLALALGLSQMASQNVRVDSLFLDEGFGALDDDTLDMALDTLAGLQQDGKLIGVISHVPALKERISTQIQVIPQSGGRSILKGPGCELVL